MWVTKSNSYVNQNEYFRFQGQEGATYDFAANSYYTPDGIVITDNLGKIIALTYNDADDASAITLLTGFVAPYSGIYYMTIGFDRSIYDSSGRIVIGEDLDTATKTDSVPVFVNQLPTGEIKIDGTAKQDETLTVSSSLVDEDGLGDFEYQWLRDGGVIKSAIKFPTRYIQ